MPSCQACGKWFSEEDRGCGCNNERLSLTRKELREKTSEDATELARLRAENERLRVALDGYYGAHQGSATISSEACPCTHCERYRTALAGKEQG